MGVNRGEEIRKTKKSLRKQEDEYKKVIVVSFVVVFVLS